MKRKIALILIVAITVCVVAASYADSRVTWKGHAYQVFMDRGTWKEANSKCKKAGGHLVTINSSAEQKIVFKLIKKHKGDVFWLGLKKTGGVWGWITGEELTYTNWAYGQPDGEYNAACGTIYTQEEDWGDGWGIKPGEWDDSNNDWDTVCYICEWEKIPVESIKLNRTKASLAKGKTLQLKVKSIKPSNAANKSIKWKTSNKKVATVDQNGKVKAVGKGTCTITCTARDGSKVAATVTITVK